MNAAAKKAPPPGPPAERLLVVEDDAYLREEIMRVLERRTPYRADAAGSGEEALEMASSRRYDLLITDVRMPGIDGIELLEAVKARRPGLLSIVITAFADEEATIRALRVGANDYIRKPFSISDLINAIDRQIAVLRLRREAERARRLLEGLVRSIDAGVLAIDGDGRVASTNSAALEMIGRSEEETLGAEVGGLLGFEGGEVVKELLDELASKRARSLEREMTVRHAGLPLTYRVGATAIRDAEGRELGTVLLFSDVSSLIQGQKLQAWKDLARTVAHEIKNPLTPIKLSAQQLLSAREAGTEALGQQLDAALGNIISNAERLDVLATEFSRFGRLPEPKMSPQDVNAVLAEVLAAFGETAEKSGIEIASELAEGLPQVDGDREALLRMAGNLIRNAVEAMPGGGTLTVATALREDGHVEMRFSDTGGGINREVRERLFLPYVTSKHGGTGLGLVVVKEIVAQHDGEIGVDSSSGEGTSIWVALPALRHD